MKYVIKEMDGQVVAKGKDITKFTNAVRDIIIPTHGSLSLEISKGQWINLLTSEWLTVTITPEPEGWD